MPVGLFIYGWCGQYHTHWIFLDIGVSNMRILLLYLTLVPGLRIRLARLLSSLLECTS